MISIFFEGDDFFKTLRETIGSAQATIDIELYYLANDDIGSGIAQLLIKKAAEGVRIRLLYDDFGCRGTSPEIFRELIGAGIAIRAYNPWLPMGEHVGRRDHRKTFLIDGRIALLGGFNLAAEYSRQCAGEKAWRDSGVRIEHPNCTDQLRGLFEETWKGRRHTFREFIRRRRKRPDWQKAPFHIVSNHGLRRMSPIRNEYLSAFVHAKKRILITNAYFVPDRGIRRALKKAARRGVDVRLLAAGKTDVRMARWAGQATYGTFLRAGVRIFEYEARVLHAKTAVVDDDWLTVGTANIDHLSFFTNLEVNLFGRDPASARTLADRFEEDLKFSREIRRDDWRRRPWWARLVERFFFLFRVWL